MYIHYHKAMVAHTDNKMDRSPENFTTCGSRKTRAFFPTFSSTTFSKGRRVSWPQALRPLHHVWCDRTLWGGLNICMTSTLFISGHRAWNALCSRDIIIIIQKKSQMNIVHQLENIKVSVLESSKFISCIQQKLIYLSCITYWNICNFIKFYLI